MFRNDTINETHHLSSSSRTSAMFFFLMTLLSRLTEIYTIKNISKKEKDINNNKEAKQSLCSSSRTMQG